MSFFHLRWGLLLLSFVASCQSSSLDQKEMEVLEKVLSELYSPLFWNLMRDKRVSQPLCRLKEVSCVRVQGVWRVAEIVTKDSEVAAMGRIPEELGELRWLQVIDLTADPSAKASLRGPIPESLGQLLQLRKLILANNQLTGALPASLFQLRQLTVLNLAGNKLSGQLGEDIGSLTQLQVLSLENNRFSGPLATSFGRLLQLKELNLAGNALTGNVIGELGHMSQLKTLSLANNVLKGHLPESLGNLQQLTKLELQGNDFLEPLPETFGRLTELKTLRVNVSTVPFTLRRLTELHDFFLNGQSNCAPVINDNCQLFENGQGCQKDEEELMPKIMQSLWGSNYELYSRRLEGCPCFWYGVSCVRENGFLRVWGLNIKDSELNGSLPDEIGSLANLKEIRLVGSLTGELPVSLSQLQQLRYLNLENNQLSGDLPSKWKAPQCTKLRSLSLSMNWLTGKLQDLAVEQLPELRILRLARNALTGSLPPDLGKLSRLRILDVRGNDQLGGEIPESLGQADSLVQLDVSNGKFRGSLPATLGNLTKLQELAINGNRFQEAFSSAFLELTRLWSFRVGSKDEQVNCAPVEEDPCNLWKRSERSKLELFLEALWTVRYWKAHSYSPSQPFCTWSGVSCEHIDGAWRVTSLTVEDPFMSGRVDRAILHLEHLKELRLRSPQLQGSMPPDLSRLRQLEVLVIEGGRMDGGIPSLGSLTQLRAVAFVGSFVGLFYLDSLPPGIREVTLRSSNLKIIFATPWEGGRTLELLDLRGVQLDGSLKEIVRKVRSWTALKSLDLSATGLQSPLPTTMYHLQSLQSLKLADNLLSGELPASLGAMTRIEVLDLSNNSITGFVPATLRGMWNLETLSLASNYLIGRAAARDCAPVAKDPCRLFWVDGNTRDVLGLLLYSYLAYMLYRSPSLSEEDQRVPPGALEMAVEYHVASIDMHKLVALIVVLAQLAPLTVIWWWALGSEAWVVIVLLIKAWAFAPSLSQARVQGRQEFHGLNFWFPAGASIVSVRSREAPIQEVLLVGVLAFMVWDFWSYQETQWASIAASGDLVQWLMADPWGGANLLKLILFIMVALDVGIQMYRSHFGSDVSIVEIGWAAARHRQAARAFAQSTQRKRWRELPRRSIDVNFQLPFTPAEDVQNAEGSGEVELQDVRSFPPRTSSASASRSGSFADSEQAAPILEMFDFDDPEVLAAWKILAEKLEEDAKMAASSDPETPNIAAFANKKMEEAGEAIRFCAAVTDMVDLLASAMEEIEKAASSEAPEIAAAAAVLAAKLRAEASSGSLAARVAKTSESSKVSSDSRAAHAAKTSLSLEAPMLSSTPEGSSAAAPTTRVWVETNAVDHLAFPNTIRFCLEVSWHDDALREQVTYKVFPLIWGPRMCVELFGVLLIGLSCGWLSLALLWLGDFWLATIVCSQSWLLLWPPAWLSMRHDIQVSLQQGYWETSLAVLRGRACDSASLIYLLVGMARFPALTTSLRSGFVPLVFGGLTCTMALNRHLCLRDRVAGYSFESKKRSPDAILRYRSRCAGEWCGIVIQLLVVFWVLGLIPGKKHFG